VLPTIRTGLLPFDEFSSPLLMNFGSRGVTEAAAYVVRTRRADSHPTGPDGRAHAARVSGHWELGAAASRKAVWWDLRLASLLTHLFVCLFVCLSARQFLTD